MPTGYYLALSALIFGVGAIGVLIKKNIITIFMCIELMLNAVNLSFIALSRHFDRVDGQAFAFFVIIVAAAEAGVGLAIIIAMFRNRETLNVDDADLMKH